jgi:predicted Zn-dependent protease
MAILSQDEARAILQKALGFSKADECEITLTGNVGGNIRYARNAVSTSGAEDNTSLIVTSYLGKKSGTATINEFDEASIQKVVRRAEELARLAPENPEYMPMLGPQNYQPSKAFFPSTAGINPDFRAEAARKSIEPAAARNITAAGYLEDAAQFQARLNSKGLFGYHRETGLTFSVTMRTADGTGSGYATADYNDAGLLDTGKLSQVALQKAAASVNAKAIEPGKYTVILEPAALVANTDASLIGALMNALDARNADEGRSFLSKKGGGNKRGEKLFDERITIYTDPLHPEVPTSTWADDGRPQPKTTWIEKGVVKNLYTSRFWAQQENISDIPPPDNFIMEGGTQSVEDMIKSTPRGILVTRLWYIRPWTRRRCSTPASPATALSTSRTARSSTRSKTSASTKARSSCSTTWRPSANPSAWAATWCPRSNPRLHVYQFIGRRCRQSAKKSPRPQGETQEWR